jgi:hypothetical protein
MTRECPICHAEIVINADRSMFDPVTCKCRAILQLDWERLETDDGPEDLYRFEIVKPQNPT